MHNRKTGSDSSKRDIQMNDRSLLHWICFSSLLFLTDNSVSAKPTILDAKSADRWSIKLIPRHLYPLSEYATLNRVRSDSEVKESLEQTRNLRTLYRLDSKNCVAVVRFDTSGAELNPEFINKELSLDYGSIPDLKNINKEQISKLWGAMLSSKNEYKTYQFVARPPFCKNKRSKYFIDVTFNEDRIKKYRVRSDEFEGAKWVSVQ